MPFPYELYPKAKETHCLNLPEISVSRPPFPGSIRTADGCFWGERDNNSYVSGATSSGQSLSSRFDNVFDEKTTQSENIACSERFNCHISCSCASGWSSSAPSGDYVYFDAPGGAVVFSAEKTLSEINIIDSMATSRTLTSITASSANDKSFRLSQTPQNYTVSVMSSSGGRCYKAACPSGYYLEKPNDTYFTVGSATGTVSGVVCYKATGCQNGYSSTGTGAGGIYHGTVCKKDECKPSCTDENNCYYGSHTVSDGCGGTCTKCYPACRVGYFYDFSMADCFVRPAVIIRDPGNPNCAKCECDNSDCRYPNGTQCECAYI